MRIIYNNYIDDLPSTSIVANYTVLNYPVTNLQDQQLAKKYRGIGLTCDIVFDMGAARAIDTFSILGHNITASATITVSANSSDSWPGVTTETIVGNANAILKFFDSAHTYRYWKLHIYDATNTDGYIEMGRVWFGDYIEVSPSSLLNFTVNKKRSDKVTIGPGRQKYASEGIGWREFKFSFPRTNYTMIKKIEDMVDVVGLHSSFIFCNFNTDRTFQIVEPCYCSFSKDLSFKHTSNMKFEYSVELEENK